MKKINRETLHKGALNSLFLILPYLFLLAISIPANADENSINYNQVSLDASASAEVDNDTMIVNLYSQHESKNAADASKRVNEKINWALAEAKKHSDIEIKTESYTTSPVYNKTQVVAWRVRQSIQLKSKNMAELSELLGTLQRQINLSRISFDVSKEKREQHTKQLIDQALDAYQQRAKQIADKVAGGEYRIVSMNVSTSGSVGHRPYTHMRAMAAESVSFDVAPQTEGGKSSLTVRVNGTIELQD